MIRRDQRTIGKSVRVEKLKGNVDILWGGVNDIIPGVHEIGKAREGNCV